MYLSPTTRENAYYVKKKKKIELNLNYFLKIWIINLMKKTEICEYESDKCRKSFSPS